MIASIRHYGVIGAIVFSNFVSALLDIGEPLQRVAQQKPDDPRVTKGLSVRHREGYFATSDQW